MVDSNSTPPPWGGLADYDEQITSLYAERARLEAENERLREALEKIAIQLKIETAQAIARAALTGIRVEESALGAESATYNERWKSKP
jgi:regulator of replication initiation timing